MNEWGGKSSILLQKVSANSSTGEQNVIYRWRPTAWRQSVQRQSHQSE